MAAGVVLYHPNLSFLSNINSYYHSVDKLIVIDNSEVRDDVIQKKLESLFPGVIYMFLNRNAGIAAALNIACRIAIEKNCNWMLTMDQDSSFNQDHLAQMKTHIPDIELEFQRVGIISPFHVLHENTIIKAAEPYTIKNIVMTSGNLLNLKAYVETGPFEEKLFMDYVDYEYCLRLRKNKYLIVQDNSTQLKHSLGDFKIKKIFWQNIGVSNHNSLRRYYMTRNSLYVGFKHLSNEKVFFLNVLKNIFFWDPFIIILFEKDRLAKLKSVYKGILHFILNKYGKATL